jgi:CubicO group peptidase (beta-lactamase class C family)
MAFVTAGALGAQSPRNPAIDAIFARWDSTTTPGCAVAATRNGQVLYERGYGMANLDYDIPNGPAMVYYIGSDSKQFTAAAVGLLALQGRISLDDDIRKYFPELPDYGTPVRVQHLIHHTSGIRDIYGLMALRGDRLEDVFPDSEALALIARQRGLAFPPGSAYSYSNSGYFLLAQLVRRVTGQPLREFADSAIFRPLGMTHTHFHDDPGHVMKQRAMSYEPDGKGGYRISYLQNFDKVGAGGLYSTIGDLRRWDENYYSHQVGGDALQRLIHTRGVLTNGDTIPYAFGNDVTTDRGLRTVEHGGSMMGYKAYVLRYPDQHLSVFATCNLGSIDPGPLAHAVAAEYLGSSMTVAAAKRAPASPPRAPVASEASGDVRPYLGTYYSDDLGVTWSVVRSARGGLALQMPRSAAQPMDSTAPGEFQGGGMRVRFERASDGGATTALVVEASRLGAIRFVKR